MGGGGRADSTTEHGGLIGGQFCCGRCSALGRPVGGGGRGGRRIRCRGWCRRGSCPNGGSTDPWTQVIHAVVAAQQFQGWAGLRAADPAVIAGRRRGGPAPPVSNTISEGDRCRERRPRADRPGESRDRPDRAAARRTVRPGVGGLIRSCRVQMVISPGRGRTRPGHRAVPDGVQSGAFKASTPCSPKGRLPRLARLLQAGWVDWAKVQTVRARHHRPRPRRRARRRTYGPRRHPRRGLGDVDVDVLVDPARPGLGLPPITRMTLPQLRAAIEAAIAAIDAEAAARRAKQARSARRVRSPGHRGRHRDPHRRCHRRSRRRGVERAHGRREGRPRGRGPAQPGPATRRHPHRPRHHQPARSARCPATPGTSPTPTTAMTAMTAMTMTTGRKTFGDIHASGDPDDIARHAATPPDPSDTTGPTPTGADRPIRHPGPTPTPQATMIPQPALILRWAWPARPAGSRRSRPAPGVPELR